jgi:broad specificity phosphatase PhoE
MKFNIIIFSISLLHPCLANDNFTLYLVRHTEKKTESTNPALTLCRKGRSKQLAILLSATNIKSIYSKSYQRTMSTVVSLSNKLNIAIKNYNPQPLE